VNVVTSRAKFALILVEIYPARDAERDAYEALAIEALNPVTGPHPRRRGWGEPPLPWYRRRPG